MIILSNLIKLVLFFYFAVIVNGQSIIENKYTFDPPQKNNSFKQVVQKSDRFIMNQGFSMMSSIINGTSQITGMYSNITKYKLTEKLQINTGIHLIQKQSNLYNQLIPDSQLDIGLKYKINNNSYLTFQLIKSTNSINRFRNTHSFNVP